MPDENKLLRELKLTPRFSCEKMSSTKPVDVCAEGLRAEYQIKTPDDGKKVICILIMKICRTGLFTNMG